MKRVSPSMAVSLLALFVALGGTGYAAAKLNGRNLVDHSVKGRKLAHNTLTGTQIRESSLGRVPSAADADFLDGRPASAYLLAGTGIAFNSQHLGGLSASAFLPAGGTAANASLLQGNPASAFLPAGGTAANSAQLGGQPASAFALADEVQGAGPVTIPMPAAGVTSRTLLTHGPLTVTAECENDNGAPAASVVVQGTGYMLAAGETDGTAPLLSGATTVAGATPGITDPGFARHGFTAFQQGFGLQGAATAIADDAQHACYLSAFAFAGVGGVP